VLLFRKPIPHFQMPQRDNYFDINVAFPPIGTENTPVDFSSRAK